MSVTITIKIASLISEVKQKSYMNTQHIKDAEDRYAARASEENNSEVMQSLQDAWRDALSLCREFLSVTADTAGNDTLDTTTTDKTMTFDFTARRTSHVAEPLAQAIHEYLVAGTLRRFYTSAAVTDMATLYAAVEKEASGRIVALLYTKGEPTIRS